MLTFYRLHDQRPSGMIPTPAAELREWNGRGFGIFCAVQKFKGPRRIENLERIRAWCCDIDSGTKAAQVERIKKSPLKPSSVVETKAGHHVYFRAAEGTQERYRQITTRLVEFFGADPNARDLARVLRVPGYLHLKDPTDPFLVKHVWGPYPATYTEREMIACFPPSREELEPRAPKPTQPLDVRGSGFWDRVFDLDCGEALLRLSGHRAVNGETYKLRPMSNGNRNVLVNGKSTSCWVDRNGRIGSHSRGGPSILRWLQWFNLSTAEAAEVIKEVFPEVAND